MEFSADRKRLGNFTQTYNWTGRTQKGFKDTVVNRIFPSFYGGSLEIKLTVPLKCNVCKRVKKKAIFKKK